MIMGRLTILMEAMQYIITMIFFIYDGVLDIQNETFDGSFLLYVELLSAGTESFQPGTFSFAFPANNSEVDGVSYFRTLELSFDGNQNNSVFDSSDPYYIAFDGTVEVTDNGNNSFTMAFDLDLVRFDLIKETFVNGSETTLEFTTTTNFDYIDRTSSGRRSRSKGEFRNKLK